MWSNELREPVTVGDNFIILPDGRRKALDLAFEAFPELKEKFDNPDDEFLDDVFFIYGLLSTEMAQQWKDEAFRKRSCEFMDRLAESTDLLLEELLVVCLLEKLGEDAMLAAQAKKCLGAKASALLDGVERDTFGR
jgi:hypothetical protein